MAFLKEKIELEVEEAEFLAQKTFASTPAWIKWSLVLLLVLTFPAYYTAKFISAKVTAANLKKIQVTAKPSFTESKGLEIKIPLVTAYTNSTYGAAALVKNPNLNLSADNISYTWKYFDFNGQEIKPENREATEGRFYILPNQQKYIISPKIVSQTQIVRAEINVGTIQWQNRQSLPKAEIEAGPAQGSQALNPLIFSAEGSIYNNSAYEIKQAILSFLVYDQNGKIAAVSQRNEFNLKPFERRAYKQIWPEVFINSGKIEILADTNLLSPDNLLLPKSTSGASDLGRPEEDNW